MSNSLYIDCVGGVAGDMLLGALIDAGAGVDAVQAALPVAGIDLDTTRVQRCGVSATKVNVCCDEQHAHRTWPVIRSIIDTGDMTARARRRAHAAFELLARSEGRMHDLPAEEVTFHEVGALDAIADICGVCIALDLLEIDHVVCSPLPLGTGTTVGAHGLLPLPAPATLDLLRGAAVYGTDRPGETVTPTGAALVASLSSSFGPLPPMTLTRVGTGAGTRNPEHVPNVVRALVGVRTEVAPHTGPLLLETNLDDLLPELVPDAMEACFAAGAKDVWTTPATMKFGRPAFVLSALVHPDCERAVAEAILRHTSSLGVRVQRTEHRWQLDRSWCEVLVEGSPVRVKLGARDGEVLNIAPEHRDCVRVARESGRSVKWVWAQALAAVNVDSPLTSEPPAREHHSHYDTASRVRC